MSLKIWLPLNGDLENKGISNLNNFSFNTFTQQSDGKIGKCYSGQGIYHITDELLQNSWSLCAWVKASSWSVNNDIILCKNTSASDNCQFYFSIINGATLNLGVNAGSSSVSFSYTFATSTWYHVAATYNGSTYALYINGEQKKTGTITNTLKTGMNNIGINCRSSNAAGTAQTGDSGKRLNDVRIYDHCLSAAEVKEISQGLILHYKLNQSNPNILPENIFDIDPWKSAIYAHELYQGRLAYRVGNNILYQKTSSGVNDVFAGTISYEANTQYTLSVTWRDDYRTDNKNSSLYLRFNYTDGSAVTNMISPANNVQEWVHQSITSTAGKTISKITTTYGNGGQLYLTDLKLEKGTIDTGLSITNNNVIIDSSGYNNNGIITGTTTITGDSPRYSFATSMNNTSTTNHIESINDITLSDNISVSFWLKASKSTSQVIFSTKNIQFGILNSLGYVLPSSAAGYQLTDFVTNSWNHICVVKNAGTFTLYVNGNKPARSGSNNYYVHNVDKLWLFNRSYNSSYGANASISDFRFYATPLLDNDVISLYNVGMKIDNLSNIHAFEFVEDGNNKVTKQGLLESALNSEIEGMSYLKYDPKIYIEPDGSSWVRIYHHNNPGGGSFSSTDDFVHSVYLDENRWFNVELCNHLDKWEFMMKGKFTSTSDQWKLRWIQTVNPMTATYAQVAAANVTKITGNGYSSYTSSWGGLYAKKSSAYLTTNNGNSGNWWGAVGSYSVYNNGIPGWGPSGTITTTGFNDLYVRIDNVAINNFSNVKSTKNNLWLAHEFIER